MRTPTLAEVSASKALRSVGTPARQVETGSDKPERIGRTAQYYGNDSLVAAVESDSSLEVYGTDGTQDTPQKWEGFGEYKVVYRLRNEGLDYLGNDTVVRNYALAHETQARTRTCGFLCFANTKITECRPRV